MSDESVLLRPSRGFWLSVPLAVAVTWGVHEFAHYQVGRLLGYDMWLSLNQVGLIAGEYQTREHGMFIAMAGPLVTYAQAAVALGLIRIRGSSLAYPFLFSALFMRLVAFAVSFSNPNDEARTSLDLGLPMWVLPSVGVALLLTMTIWGSRTLRVRWRTNGLLYLAVSALTAAIVLGDPVVGRILGR